MGSYCYVQWYDCSRKIKGVKLGLNMISFWSRDCQGVENVADKIFLVGTTVI